MPNACKARKTLQSRGDPLNRKKKQGTQSSGNNSPQDQQGTRYKGKVQLHGCLDLQRVKAVADSGITCGALALCIGAFFIHRIARRRSLADCGRKLGYTCGGMPMPARPARHCKGSANSFSQAHRQGTRLTSESGSKVGHGPCEEAGQLSVLVHFLITRASL